MRNFTISNYPNTGSGSYGKIVKGLLLSLAIVLFNFTQVYAQEINFEGEGPRESGSFSSENGLVYFMEGDYELPGDSLNPDLAANLDCANLRVVLVLDESGSMKNNGEPAARDGAWALAKAFKGSDARLIIVEFESIATEITNLEAGRGELFKGVVDDIWLANFYDYLYSSYEGQQYYVTGSTAPPCRRGYTNWEDALLKSNTFFPNLVLFLTDGDPTAHNTVEEQVGGCHWFVGTTPIDQPSLAKAITQANVLKSEGVHIFSIGVGSNVNVEGLKLISGYQNYADNGDLYTDDYSIGGFDAIKNNLTSGINKICGTEITIDKSVDFNQVCSSDEVVTFSITVTNSGGVNDYAASEIVVQDTFPSFYTNLSIVGAPIAGAEIVGQNLTYNVESLGHNESVTIQVSANLSGPHGTYLNTAYARADNANEVKDNASVKKTDTIHSNIYIEECGEYTWDKSGDTYISSGQYFSLGETESGCPRLDTLELTINEPRLGSEAIDACISYEWNGGVFDASGSYTHNFTGTNGLCDSTATLLLTIHQPDSTHEYVSTCESYYEWNDDFFYETGTFSKVFPGVICDSVATLHITFNQPGDETVVACDSYEWNGTVYDESGTYPFESECGTVNLLLTINFSNTGTDTQVACGPYTWIDGETYTENNNTATHTLTNVAGCDSIVTLNLTIGDIEYTTDTQIACDSYTWIDGIEYTSDNNTATWPVINEAGCNGIVTLDLTINHSNTGIDTQVACDSYTWIDGIEYTSNNNTATWTLENEAGCDSVVTLNLTIGDVVYTTDTQVACDSFTWIDGIEYTADNNTATWSVINDEGCDGVVTLNLSINHSNTGVDTQVACGSYTWIDGETYTESNNTATHTLTNVAGCDSVVTLNLTIGDVVYTTDRQVACDSFTWIDGIEYTSDNNTATWPVINEEGCDGVVTLDLTINHSNTGIDSQEACDSYTWIDGVTYTSNNNTATWTLVNEAGCDSVVTLNLFLGNCGSVDDCEFVYFLSDDDIATGISDIYGVTLSGGIATMNFIAQSPIEVHIAYEADQKLIYAVSKHTNSYRILDPATATWFPTVPLTKNVGQITAAVFNHDGKLLIGSQNHKKIYSVNVSTQAVSTYDEYAPVSGGDLAFGADGMLYMATRSGNGLYKVWTDPVPDDLIGSLPAKVTGLAITDLDQLLISADGNTSLVIRNTNGSDPGVSYNLMFNGEPYTLRSGDMASGCSSSEDIIEGCANYKLYYVHQPQGGGQQPLLEVTLNSNGTASYTTVLPNLGGHIGITSDGNTIYSVVGNKLKTVDVSSVPVVATQTIKTAGGTALSGFPAVVVSHDGTIYAGRSTNNQVYTIDPVTAVATPYGPSRNVNGGDLIELDGEIWLITRSNNKFTNVLTGASFVVPVNEINGAAVLGNGNVLLADGNGGSLLKVVDPSTQAVVRTYDIGLPLFNGDLAGVCVGSNPDIITGTCYASGVVEYVQGTTRSGGVIGSDRNDPNEALGTPERTDQFVFVSLGYGGSLTLSFDGAIPNGPGADIEIVETSFGSPSCTAYPEYADVSVSVDGIVWHPAGTVCRTNGFIDLDDVAGGTLDHVYFVKIVNNNTMTTTPDGFDVDGVVAIHNCIDEEVDVPPTSPFLGVESNSVLTSYPNPTKGQSKVVFTTGQTTRTLVEVYDMNGRNVGTLFNEEAQKGKEYTIDFNANNLSNGVYIYRMTTNNETIIEKFMIAR